MQTPLAAILLITLMCGLTLAASISGEPERLNEELAPYMNIAAKAPSNQAYMAWVRYMMKNNRQQAEKDEDKRMSDFTAPYMKYRQDKRNNGVWIWMPAQGYVSVPHQQEDRGDALTKPGKIMRYGK